MKRFVVVLVAVMLPGSLCLAQVRAPKHESRLKHLFSSHRDRDNLAARYADLRCAMVTIEWTDTLVFTTTSQPGQPPLTQQMTITHFGTGFYTSADGDVTTAAHVVGNKSWSDAGTGMVVSIATPQSWEIQNSKEEKLTVTHERLVNSPDAWGADLALIQTNHAAPCWLRMRSKPAIGAGEHVITLGFPALAFGSLTMYTGIVSARLKSDLPVGITIQGAPVKPQNEFLRIQMPLSPGLSGGGGD